MENMAENPEVSWRSQSFRQNVIAKIEEAIRQSGNPTTKSVAEMETHVFQKAKTREEYLGFVARLIIHVREMNETIRTKRFLQQWMQENSLQNKTLWSRDQPRTSTSGNVKQEATSSTPNTSPTTQKAREDTAMACSSRNAADASLNKTQDEARATTSSSDKQETTSPTLDADPTKKKASGDTAVVHSSTKAVTTSQNKTQNLAEARATTPRSVQLKGACSSPDTTATKQMGREDTAMICSEGKAAATSQNKTQDEARATTSGSGKREATCPTPDTPPTKKIATTVVHSARKGAATTQNETQAAQDEARTIISVLHETACLPPDMAPTMQNSREDSAMVCSDRKATTTAATSQNITQDEAITPGSGKLEATCRTPDTIKKEDTAVIHSARKMAAISKSQVQVEARATTPGSGKREAASPTSDTPPTKKAREDMPVLCSDRKVESTAATSQKKTQAQNETRATTSGSVKQEATTPTPDTTPTKRVIHSHRKSSDSDRKLSDSDICLQVAVEREDKDKFSEIHRINFIDSLGTAILELPEEGDVPLFCSTKIKNQHYLVISAMDESSRDWLTTLVPTLKLWGTSLRAFPASEMTRPYKALVKLPGQDLKPYMALKLLHRQNKMLEVDTWRILDYKQKKHALRLLVGMEEVSVVQLRLSNFQLFYKSVLAKITLIGSKSTREDPKEMEGIKRYFTGSTDDVINVEDEGGSPVKLEASSKAQKGMATCPTVAKD